jgi:PKD repeat protein
MKSLRNLIALNLLAVTIALRAAPPALDASLALGGNQLALHWKSIPGQVQQIQVSGDLIHWTNLPPLFASAFADSVWTDDGTLTGGVFDARQSRFYRLSLPQAAAGLVGVGLELLPPSSGSGYSWNFGDGASAAAATPNHTYQADGVYTVTSVVSDVGGSHTNTGTLRMETGAQILLTPAVLAAVRQKATSNTPQWQTFKQRLDGQLTEIIESGGAYQGDELSWIGDYALGYKTLQFQDPVTAARYADKAIALMKSALNDFQKFGEYGQQYLARGDGSTKVFTLPSTNIVASSLTVYKAPTSVMAVTRVGSGKTDTVDSYLTYIKVSNTSDGPADYREGTDWRHNGDLPNNLIDWSAAQAGHLPAPGSTYYITVTSSLDARSTTASLSGNTVSLSTAPKTNEAVYVEYVYGIHAPDYSSLAFQQSSAGDGGFNSIMIDDGFTSRYLGKFTSMGYDWLYGYPGFNPTLKNQIASMLVRWSDYWRDNGYRADNPASNYGEGGYISRVLTALALGAGRDTNSARLVSEIINYRQTNVLPLLTNTANSLFGGFWAEGWNYGQQATRNLILSGLAQETAGLGSATAERQWAGQVIYSLITEQPTKATIYDGGDWYDYPAPFVSKDLLYDLAFATTNDTARTYANYIIQNYPGGQTEDMQDLLFRDPNATASFWSSLPLDYFAQGTGLITARADWNYNSTWISFQLGNELDTDHQTYAQGHLEVQRGPDALLINPNALGGNQTPSTESSFANLLTIDDNGVGTQTYRFNQGFWFGTPGCRILNYEAANGYVYAMGDYAAAYALNTTPGIGTAKLLTRQIVYQRPDYVVVHDRAVTKSTNDLKQLRWHFLNNPTLIAGSNSWVATAGSSKLFGQTFSRLALISSNQAVTCPAGSSTVVYRITTQNATKATNVTYTTALQSAPSTTANRVTTAPVFSSDHRMEGVQLGNSLVLFGADAPLVPFNSTLTYTVTGSSPVVHVLTDLPPNRAFQVSAGGNLLGTFTASPQGTLLFTNTPSGSEVITIQ